MEGTMVYLNGSMSSEQSDLRSNPGLGILSATYSDTESSFGESIKFSPLSGVAAQRDAAVAAILAWAHTQKDSERQAAIEATLLWERAHRNAEGLLEDLFEL